MCSLEPPLEQKVTGLTLAHLQTVFRVLVQIFIHYFHSNYWPALLLQALFASLARLQATWIQIDWEILEQKARRPQRPQKFSPYERLLAGG